MIDLVYAEALTPREMRAAELWAMGRTSKQVGDEMNISYRTVETYIQNVYRKRGLESRADVFDWFWRDVWGGKPIKHNEQSNLTGCSVARCIDGSINIAGLVPWEA